MATDIENSEKSHTQWVCSARAKLDRFVAARLAPPPYLRWADARLAVLGGLHACEKTRPTTPNLGFGGASNGASYAAHAAKAPASRTLSGRKRNAVNGAAPGTEPRPAGLAACSCQCPLLPEHWRKQDSTACRSYSRGYGTAKVLTKSLRRRPRTLSPKC